MIYPTEKFYKMRYDNLRYDNVYCGFSHVSRRELYADDIEDGNDIVLSFTFSAGIPTFNDAIAIFKYLYDNNICICKYAIIDIEKYPTSVLIFVDKLTNSEESNAWFSELYTNGTTTTDTLLLPSQCSVSVVYQEYVYYQNEDPDRYNNDTFLNAESQQQEQQEQQEQQDQAQQNHEQQNQENPSINQFQDTIHPHPETTTTTETKKMIKKLKKMIQKLQHSDIKTLQKNIAEIQENITTISKKLETQESHIEKTNEFITLSMEKLAKQTRKIHKIKKMDDIEARLTKMEEWGFRINRRMNEHDYEIRKMGRQFYDEWERDLIWTDINKESDEDYDETEYNEYTSTYGKNTRELLVKSALDLIDEYDSE
jgi:hypothetical protein